MKPALVLRTAGALLILGLLTSCAGNRDVTVSEDQGDELVLIKLPSEEGAPEPPEAPAQQPAAEPASEPAKPADTVAQPAEKPAEPGRTTAQPAAERSDIAAEPVAGPAAEPPAEPAAEPPAEPEKGTGAAEVTVGSRTYTGEALAEREMIADLYMRAQKRYFEGDLAGARRLLSGIREGQPYYDMAQRLLKVVDADIEAARASARIEQEDRLDRKDRVEALYRKAEMAYNAKRYVDAVEIIEEAYRLDPRNPKVRELRADARVMKATEDMHINSAEQDIRIAEAMSAIEKVGTIPPELPRAPRPEPEEEEDDPAAKALEEKLNQKISVNLDDTPLDYLLNILFRATGVNIIADPNDLEGQTIKIHAEDIALKELLEYISKTKGVTFTRSGNAIWMQGGGQAESGPVMHWYKVPLTKGLVEVSSQDVSDTSDLEKMLEKVTGDKIIDWPDGSQYYLDRKTNVLLVKTTSEALQEFIDVVKAIDVTPVQVLIETKFIEVSNRDLDDLGIEWHTTSDIGIGRKNGANRLQIDAGMGVTLPAPVSYGSDFPDAGFDAILAGVMTEPQFQLTLHALRATGHTSTLAEPRLIALNNGSPEIEITRTEFYVTDYTIDRQNLAGYTVGTGDESTTNSEYTTIIKPEYEEVEVGFKLKVTPSVGSDLKEITLYIEPEINEVVDTVPGMLYSTVQLVGEGNTPTTEKPIVSTRKLKAKLTVSDGYVVVLGGLVRQTKEEGEVKVPLLGDIPLLGALFRHRTEKNIKKNLLIFVSAKIITPEGRMYVGAGPETLGLGGEADEARSLLDRIEVNVN